MTGPGEVRLADLDDCFEGVIPSILATASADGTPNVSYLSHVVRVDADHVALSHQFFGKTLANLQANPQAALILVDGASGRQFRLDAIWIRDEADGPLFEEIATALAASSAQIGMSDVMRLESVWVFRVARIHALPHPDGAPHEPVATRPPALPRLGEAIAAISAETESGAIVSALLDRTLALLRCPAAILFQHDPARDVLVTAASRGYPRSGVGSEVAMGVGVAGAAAASRRPIRISDASRVFRFGAAILNSSAAEAEDAARTIPLPGLDGAQSRIAVPIVARGALWGALFAESPDRLAFRAEDAQALGVLANHAAAALLLGEALAEEGPASAPPRAGGATGAEFRVLHHGFDDSVFIDNEYVIRGVAGRVLVFLLRRHAEEGRTEFSNREIRLAPELRLPEYKDNLETRLLLLRQRLEEKDSPVQLQRAGRGLVRLALRGRPRLESAG